jgi:hypothetical protein
MAILYHGSPFLFKSFNLEALAEGSGIKFGAGVYLTESLETAIRYSAPRHMTAERNFIYTVEVPDKTDLNYLPYPAPVQAELVQKIEDRLNEQIPEFVKSEGKLLRKYLAHRLEGVSKDKLLTEKQVDKKTTLEGEKRASQLFVEVGVIYIEWPNGGWANYPNCIMNIAVLDPDVITVLKIEEIDRQQVKGKWVAASSRDVTDNI